MTVAAVWFDVGETLIDETREYGIWADWLDVPRHTFSAVFGSIIARGGDFMAALRHFNPDFDLAVERDKRAAAGLPEVISAADLYPDALPCLEELKAAGYFVGIAGNQSARVGHCLREIGFPADSIGTSEEWGTAKPSPAFFARMVKEAGVAAAQVAYVGDRLDNDVCPALAMGLSAIWIRRGPWGQITRPSFRVPVTVDSLRDLRRHL